MNEPSPSPRQTRGHQTALHRAAAVGNSNAMAALVQGGCALDLQERDGNTALHEVSWHGFYPCVKLLVKAGADVHVRNKVGNVPLHLACQNAHTQVVRLLLLGGSRPDTKNKMGDTCLHVAARYNNINVVKVLLSSLCCGSEVNEAGDTPLHVAAALNHKKTVHLLLEAGMDANAQNYAGETALDKARDHNNREVSLLLARAPQVHRFMRGRTTRRRRERLKAERRTQSVTREDIQTTREQESEGPVEDDPPSREERVNRAAIAKTGHHGYRQHGRRLPGTGEHHGGGGGGGAGGGGEGGGGGGGGGEADMLGFQRRKGPMSCDRKLKDRAYQLFTLYRDREGVVRQAPANGCHCRPLFQKLEGQIQATQEEMKAHMLTFQDQVNLQLGRLEHRNRHQMKVLLHQERVATEREDMTGQQAREEHTMRQQDLKRWDVDLPASPECYTRLPSLSAEPSVADGELEALLSLVPGDSSTSLATYVNVSSSPSSASLLTEDRRTRTAVPERKYFEIKVERSPDYENTALCPLPSNSGSGLLGSAADPCWQPPGITANRTIMGFGREKSSSSSSQSAGSTEPREARPEAWGHHPWGHDPRGHDPRGHEPWGQSCRQHRSRLRERMLAHRQAAAAHDGTGTLEVFIDPPGEPTFIQQKNSLHAVEVTQRFFETVSTQLERWYERKVLEAKQQTERRAQEDREQLLQRITALEEELQRLAPNEEAEGTS